ncbi:hypothetical protein GCM10028796_37780 [Ramlibacter monticola]|uniref:Acyltransferase n=1 Tax=Ramlibacter monticola TaxID=1926872 RepID=A0A936Z9X3_9BURK|nr:acyltransferase [Ramlibacter monticola]MBL0395021.1 acyltransferase [Ramlibacter monticola]
MTERVDSSREYQLLDVARCVAISLVILHHVGFRFPSLSPGALGGFLQAIGWSGVDIFFAISGFLITRILVRSTGPGSTRSFFIRRAFRILPLYIVALSVYLVLSILQGSDRDLALLVWNALLLTGWAVPILGAENIPYLITWSISVEEFAYVALGLAAMLWRRRLAVLLLSALFAALALRAVLVLGGGIRVQDVYYFPPLRVDSIAFGGLLALGYFKPRKRWLPVVLAALAAVYLWLHSLGQYSKSVATLGYTVLPLTITLLTAYLVREERSASPLIRFMAFVGQRSYFIYLFHVFVVGALTHPYFRDLCASIGFWGVFLLAMAVTLALAELSWRFFEHPLIRLGRSIASQMRAGLAMRSVV